MDMKSFLRPSNARNFTLTECLIASRGIWSVKSHLMADNIHSRRAHHLFTNVVVNCSEVVSIARQWVYLHKLPKLWGKYGKGPILVLLWFEVQSNLMNSEMPDIQEGSSRWVLCDRREYTSVIRCINRYIAPNKKYSHWKKFQEGRGYL